MKKKILPLAMGMITLTLASLCLFFFLPHISTIFLQKVTKELPLIHKEITISHITPWKTEGYLKLSQGTNELSIARFEIRYKPLSILEKRINSLVLQGVELSIKEPFPASNTAGSTTSFDMATVLNHLPFSIDKITADNAHFTIQRQDHLPLSTTINSQTSLTTSRNDRGSYRLENISTQITIQGDIDAQGQAEFLREDKQYSLQISATNNMETLSRRSPMMGGLGTLQSKASLTFSDDLSSIQRIKVRLASDNLDLHYGDIHLSTKTELPLTVDLLGTPEDFTFTSTNLNIVAPYQLNGDIKGRYQAANRSYNAEAVIRSPLSEPPLFLSLKTDGETIDFKTESGKRTLHIANQNVSIGTFTAHAKGKYSQGIFDGNTSITIDQIKLPQPALTIKNISYNQNLHLVGNEILKGTGTFTFKDISYNKNPIGQLFGTTNLGRRGATFSIQGTTPLHKTLHVNCSGSVLFPSIDGNLECILPPTFMTENNLPATINTENGMKDIHFTGLIQSNLQLRKHGTIAGTLSSKISHATVQREDNLLVTGINTSLTFPLLPRLQSSPGQLLSIDKIKMGTTTVTDAQLYFRLEDLDNLFIEKSRFSWCNGTVESGSMNINSAGDAYNVTLYCDRIGFTELLNQLGVLDAKGTGTLNGRLPISYYDSTLHFDDGFLFSSPGDNGIVKFSNTDTVRQYMGTSLETTYLDYSINALENFVYNWATLSFNSSENELIISMSLDGKPASPLPYAYNNGNLIPSNAGPGIQHPILLDVNFHLPAAEIFRYGKNIQSFMEKM